MDVGEGKAGCCCGAADGASDEDIRRHRDVPDEYASYGYRGVPLLSEAWNIAVTGEVLRKADGTRFRDKAGDGDGVGRWSPLIPCRCFGSHSVMRNVHSHGRSGRLRAVWQSSNEPWEMSDLGLFLVEADYVERNVCSERQFS